MNDKCIEIFVLNDSLKDGIILLKSEKENFLKKIRFLENKYSSLLEKNKALILEIEKLSN